MHKKSKPLGVKDTVSFEKHFNHSLIRLTIIYSCTLAVILVISGTVTYSIFANRLKNRIDKIPLPPTVVQIERQGPTPEEVREDLILSIIIVDLSLLLMGVILGHGLARLTLKPLKNAYEEQRRFVGDASHELRTPLAIMKIELEGQISSKENKSLLEEVDSMTSIVNNLLTLAKFEEKEESNTVSFNIVDSSKEVVKRMQKIADTYKVALTFSSKENDFKIKGDQDVFSHALANFIKNGIIYNKENGTVAVSISGEKNKITISIKDTGIGISSEDQNHIFDRFYRVDKSRSRKTGGSGLGLSIAERGIHRLGGTCTVESEVDKGTVINIIFPLA